MEPLVITSVVSLISALFGGGVVAALLRFRIQSRTADLTDFGAINAVLVQQRDEAFERIDKLEQRVESQEAEISGLRIARDLDPFPNWIVDLQGHYNFVNRPFEECFLEPQKKTYRDIIGKTHEDFWPATFVETLRTLDTAARKRPDGAARANTTLSLQGVGEWEITVHKIPCRIKGIIVAYAGYITIMEPVMERVGWSNKGAAE